MALEDVKHHWCENCPDAPPFCRDPCLPVRILRGVPEASVLLSIASTGSDAQAACVLDRRHHLYFTGNHLRYWAHGILDIAAIGQPGGILRTEIAESQPLSGLPI